MTAFRSILFGDHAAPAGIDSTPEPGCFADLNLDQAVAAIVAGREPYGLTGYFHSLLGEVDLVAYRQAVFRDLDDPPTRAAIDGFAASMRAMRGCLANAGKARYSLQRQRWYLDAAIAFSQAVESLAADLDATTPRSEGLRGVASYLVEYLGSSTFTALHGDARAVLDGLDAIRYAVWISGAKVTVGAFDDESDYSAEVAATFERFQQHDQTAITTRRGTIGPGEFTDHVEGAVLDRVAQVFPERFTALRAFCEGHTDFPDATLAVFDREVQFYLAYLDYIAPMRRASLPMSYPRLSDADKTEQVTEAFDVVLAAQLVAAGKPVVGNDIRLDAGQRILVVSGPNNGGKTTLARTVGQMHCLARLGCPVAAGSAQLFLVDEVLTHFEREENIDTLAGKLQNELDELHAILERATPRSLIIMNEMFSSTTVHDALFLSREILTRVSALDALGVCVTFLDELSTLDDKTVSMVSTVDPDNPAVRTYKVIRRPADGRAYARALAERYGLTYDTLNGRLRG